MKLIEGLIKLALWLVGIAALVLFGWCLRGYKARKEAK